MNMQTIEDFKIGFIPSHNVNLVWTDVQPFIEKVLDMYDTHKTLDEIYDNLTDNKYWLVVVTINGLLRGVLICSVEHYNEYDVFFVSLASGVNLYKHRLQILDFLKQGAKRMNVDYIEWRGRPGYMKVFRDIAKVKHVSMIVELENDNE